MARKIPLNKQVSCIECKRRVIRYSEDHYKCRTWGKMYVYATCCHRITPGPICWRCLVPHLNMHTLAGTGTGTMQFFEVENLAYIIKRSEEWGRKQAGKN
jgi:predicted nucleic-acid-binding Zn-ribbon protein